MILNGVRHARLRLIPVNVGFCKLDPIINGETTGFDLNQLGLKTEKKTLIYAPTFYPSSIERFPKNFPEDFSKYNILIKV